MLGLLLLSLFVVPATSDAPLPTDCHPAQRQAFSTLNPAGLYGTSREIGQKATPQRVGSLRQQGPLPTGHFATGHIKNKDVWPMILIPYQVLLKSDGAVADAYTMDRWSDPERTDFMEQQSAHERGKPWNVLRDMGSNMRQMTSGPDGNPRSGFNGRSGVKVSIPGMGEPEMTSFGELFANFKYSGNGGTMELPLVRGASMMTYKIQNANPVVQPFCLSSINKHQAKFDCPVEASAGDGGGGHIEGSCSGGVLTITLHNTKAVRDITKLQWAVEPSGQWGSTYMRSCDAQHCSSENGGKTIKMRIPNAHGQMSFAVNYIGHYILPPDWSHQPEKVNCIGKREVKDTQLHHRARRGLATLGMRASCSSSRDITVTLYLGDVAYPGDDKFQYALEPASTWHAGYVPPMRNCDASHCQHVGNTVVIHTTAPADNYRLALNIIGTTTLPMRDWLSQPYDGTCGGNDITDGEVGGGGHAQPTAAPVTDAPSHTNAPYTSAPHTNAPHNHDNGPAVHVAYTAGDISKPQTKFVMELDEPGDDLPDRTRKFILYFSSPVKAQIDTGSNHVTFTAASGEKFSGIMQMAYAGSTQRGDGKWVSHFDSTAGVYPYKSEVEYCISASQNKAYVRFDWRPTDVSGNTVAGTGLEMVAMPHQALLLNSLKDTPFTFKGKMGADWLMSYDVLHTAVDPDPLGVAKLKANPAHLHDVTAAIARDAEHDYLDSYCAHTDSYNGGKGIGMSTRLASISRALGTFHHQKTDASIKRCLEKWLRVDDSLDAMWRFKYDEVWGGLYLRATNEGSVPWGVDYGFPYYNDHHFHLGYFLYALAYYVKHYPQWGQTHKERIYTLARDVGNPSTSDPYFPVSRQKDIYTGWSWASGLVPGTRQEESASEGINAYHGLAALGDAFGDDNMRQTGQVLLAMEVQSVREYWQVRAHNRAHFPPAIQATGVVGMVTEPDFFAYTLNWPCDPNIFPQRHACLVGIQVIPITAVSKYWVDQEWAGSVSDACEAAINPSSDPDYSKAEMTSDLQKPLNSGWQAFCYAAMAPKDAAHAQRAADYVKDKTPQQLVGGTGAASTLMFIYAQT